MRYENITGIFFDVGWTLLGPRYGNWAYNTAKMHELMHSELFLSIPEERRREVFAHAQRFLESHLLVGTEEEELAINREFFSIIARGLPELGLTNSDVGEIARDKVYNMENSFISTTRRRCFPSCAANTSSASYPTPGRRFGGCSTTAGLRGFLTASRSAALLARASQTGSYTRMRSKSSACLPKKRFLSTILSATSTARRRLV